MTSDNYFWKNKPLRDLSDKQWEALCDGCGLCCLEKIEDEDTGTIYYTQVACEFLDINSCRCNTYTKRQRLQKNCLILSPETLKNFHWLPKTCAYRLLSEGLPLPDWHPLISQNPNSIHTQGISIRYKCISSRCVDMNSLEAYIIEEEIY